MALTMKQSTASLRAGAAPAAGRRALVCKATKYDDELIATAVSINPGGRAPQQHTEGADLDLSCSALWMLLLALC
jgi:hypothetical protein